MDEALRSWISSTFHEILEYKGCRKRREIFEQVNELWQPFMVVGPDIESPDELKVQGNIEFKARRYLESIRFYSMALLKLKDNERLSAILFSNRSAALGALGHWNEALRDSLEAIRADPRYEKGLYRRDTALKHTTLQSNRQLEVCRELDGCEVSTNRHGRCVESTDTVSRNTVLIRESPVAVVRIGNHLTICAYCCSSRIALIPCCDGEMYCSRECQSEARSKWHAIECQVSYYRLFHPELRLAVRLVTMYRSGFDLHHIDQLQTHYSNIDPQEYIQMAIEAAVVTNLIGVKEDSFEYYSKCLQYLCQIKTNVHAITQIPYQKTNVLLQSKIGIGIYPMAAMLNHSCRPNCRVVFHNARLEIVATNDICTGDELCISYGPHHVKMNHHDRQTVLNSQYYFQCDCQACIRDKENSNPKLSNDLICPDETCRSILTIQSEVVCPSCNRIYAREDLYARLKPSTQCIRMTEQRNDPLKQKEIQNLHDAIRQLQQCLQPNSAMLARAHDRLAKAYAAHGNFEQAATHCEVSVAILETGYSKHDVELGYEYLKLAQIYFNLSDWSKCKLRLNAAQDILQAEASAQVHEEMTRMRLYITAKS